MAGKDAGKTDGPALGRPTGHGPRYGLQFEAQILKSTGSTQNRSAAAEFMWMF